MIKRGIYWLFMILCMVIITNSVSAQQCDDEDFLDDCAALLGDYRFIKSYNTSISKSKKGVDGIEYSYVFSKGTNYVITICDENIEGKKMILNLYDRNRKLITSSYNKRAKKYYSKIGYACTATGVYYLKTTIEGGESGCGICILGFKK